MWIKAKVAADGAQERKVFADFDGPVPHFVEWPDPLAYNAEVMVNEAPWYASGCKLCGGLYHVALMPARRYPVEEEIVVPADVEPARKRKSK